MMTIVSSNAKYDQGPGNETIEDAYYQIRTIRLHEQSKRQDKRQETIRGAILFLLARTGAFPHDTTTINDTRCLLYAIEILDGLASHFEFVSVYEGLWQALGSLSGAVLSRIGRTHVAIDRFALGETFREGFRNAKWPVRTQVIEGFKMLAVRTHERDGIFWNTTELFLQECRDHLPDAKRHGAVHALVNFWWTLANGHGKDDEAVRRYVAQNAYPLLLLIQDAHLRISINPWYESLRKLELPHKSERDGELQTCLEKVAEEIGKVENNPDWWLKDWFREYKGELMPYLHGRAPRPPRIIPAQTT